jgi:hypothetical protein
MLIINKNLLVVILVALIAALYQIDYESHRTITYFEIIDEHWLPSWMKNFLQDTMFFKWNLTFQNDLFDEKIITELIQFFQTHPSVTRIVAIGAGGGGVEPFLLQTFRDKYNYHHNITLTLTDLVPNIERWESVKSEFPELMIDYISEPIDATNLPVELNGVRFFSGMIHHFEPSLIREILQDCLEKSQSIVIIDGKSSFSQALIGPFRSAALSLLTPVYSIPKAIRSRNADANADGENLLKLMITKVQLIWMEFLRCLFTWTGILPFIQAHDMFVSNLRFYSQSDFQAIISSLSYPNDQKEFDFFYYFSNSSSLTLTIGTPKTPLTTPN